MLYIEWYLCVFVGLPVVVADPQSSCQRSGEILHAATRKASAATYAAASAGMGDASTATAANMGDREDACRLLVVVVVPLNEYESSDIQEE